MTKDGGEYDESDVKIRWRKHMVTLRDKKVAWYDDENQIKMTKAARKFEKKSEGALQKWITKRRKDPETDRPGTGNKPINVKTDKSVKEEKTADLIRKSQAKRGAPGTLKRKVKGKNNVSIEK